MAQISPQKVNWKTFLIVTRMFNWHNGTIGEMETKHSTTQHEEHIFLCVVFVCVCVVVHLFMCGLSIEIRIAISLTEHCVHNFMNVSIASNGIDEWHELIELCTLTHVHTHTQKLHRIVHFVNRFTNMVMLFEITDNFNCRTEQVQMIWTSFNVKTLSNRIQCTCNLMHH